MTLVSIYWEAWLKFFFRKILLVFVIIFEQIWFKNNFYFFFKSDLLSINWPIFLIYFIRKLSLFFKKTGPEVTDEIKAWVSIFKTSCKTSFRSTNDCTLIFNIESPCVVAQHTCWLFKKTFFSYWFKFSDRMNWTHNKT